jgi:hypothetical protein
MHSYTIPQWDKIKGNENVSFMTVWFDLSPVQAARQSVLLAAGQKVLCTQIPVITLLIIFAVTA